MGTFNTQLDPRRARYNALGQPAGDQLPTTGSQTAAPQPQNVWMTQPQPYRLPTAGTKPNVPTMSTPAAPPMQTAGPQNALSTPGIYGGGRGNYMGYGPNAGGLRLDPNYLPENWNYQDTPEFQWQLQQGLKGANRRLLNMGRSDSTGGINALNNFESNLRAQEVDKAYQRALNANMANYARYTGANVENYGRTRGEDQTGWDRAFALGNQDWNRNYQLANLGLGAAQTGVQAGNATGANIADALTANGANQAALALRSGAVSADTIQGMLNAGWTYLQIEQAIKNGSIVNGGYGGGAGSVNPQYGSAAYNAPLGGGVGPGAPNLPAYGGGGVGAPDTSYAGAGSSAPSWMQSNPSYAQPSMRPEDVRVSFIY